MNEPIEGHVLTEQEEVEHALQVLRKHGTSRGDSFDLGGGEVSESGGGGDLMSLLSNPQKLIGSLNLTEKQADNIASVLTGGIAGAGRKWLTRYLGAELAGAVSGFLGGYISKKVIGR